MPVREENRRCSRCLNHFGTQRSHDGNYTLHRKVYVTSIFDNFLFSQSMSVYFRYLQNLLDYQLLIKLSTPEIYWNICLLYDDCRDNQKINLATSISITLTAHPFL